MGWGTGQEAADLGTGPRRDWVQVLGKTKGIQRLGTPPTHNPYQARASAPPAPAFKSRPRLHYYSLGCVRRMGRQIRGTLRLPESRGAGRPLQTPVPPLLGLGLSVPQWPKPLILISGLEDSEP